MTVRITITLAHVGLNVIASEITYDMDKSNTCIHELEMADKLKNNLDVYFNSLNTKPEVNQPKGENRHEH